MRRFQSVLGVVTLAVLALAPLAARAQGAGGPPAEVVAFGDSLSAGYGVGPGESFPEQLQAALQEKGVNATVTNAGVSGDTSTGGLARLDWSVPDSAAVVIVELGANDALRGVSPAITEANLDAILSRLKARQGKTRVILAGMVAPPNMGPDYADAFNPIYPRLAQKYGVAFYPFFLEGVAAASSLNQGDAMHPNKAGVAEIVRRMLPLVTEALSGAPAPAEAR